MGSWIGIWCFYRLSIVTMPLSTEAVWSQFAMQVFGVEAVPPFGVNGGESVASTCFLRQFFYKFSHNTYVADDRQTDRQTDDTSYHKRDRQYTGGQKPKLKAKTRIRFCLGRGNHRPNCPKLPKTKSHASFSLVLVLRVGTAKTYRQPDIRPAECR